MPALDDDALRVRVGAGVLVGLVVAATALLGLEGRHVRPGMRFVVAMDRVGGLQAGARVRFSGLTVGSVDAIRLVTAARSDDPVHVELDVWVERRHAWLLRESTEFFVNQESLLGDSHLAIAERAASSGPALVDGARVAGIAPPRLDRLLGQSLRNLEAATALIRDGMPELQALGAALTDLRVSLDALEDPKLTGGSVLRLWAELQWWAALDVENAGTPVDEARRVAHRASAELGALGPRVRRLATALSTLGGSETDPRVSRLVAALHRAALLLERGEALYLMTRGLVERVQRGQGTLGALLADVELVDEMKEITRIMKRQPWRILGKPAR